MKIKEAIEDYLVEIEIRKYTPVTIKNQRSKLNQFMKFCEENEITDIDEVSLPVVKKYTQHLIQKGYKGLSINGMLKVIKVFIQYCYDEEYGGFNTNTKKIKWVKQDKPVVKSFTVNDVKTMLNECKGNNYLDIRDKTILIMLFETGIRVSELRTITAKDIFDDYILITGKGRKQRVVPITPMVKKALMRYQRAKDSYFKLKMTEDFLFLSYRGKAFTNTGIEFILKKRGKAVKDVRVSPHTCRHFFAQQQIKMGVDVYTISRLLGHENISITQIYLNSLKNEDLIKLTKNNSVLMNM